MWLFTKNGFFSAVANRHDPTKIHVRSQFKGDLEKLINRYWYVPENHAAVDSNDLNFLGLTQEVIDHRKELVGDSAKPVVIETPEGDYRFCADFPREMWSYIVSFEAMNIDYVKFKPAVHDGTVRDSIYMNVFFDLMRAKANNFIQAKDGK